MSSSSGTSGSESSSLAKSLSDEDQVNNSQEEESSLHGEGEQPHPGTARKIEKKKWIERQKKAFLHWINGYLAMGGTRIDDILEGFRNGVNLIVFLQYLTGATVTQGYSKKPKLRVHKITNCFIALKFLEELKVTGLTVSAEDFVDASPKNLKYILGFCWMLLRRFQNIPGKQNESHEEHESAFETRLLEWIADMTQEYDLDIHGFSSLHDGKAIFALLEKYDKSIVNFSEINWDNPLDAVTLALQLAEKHLGIPSDILDPEELISGTVSEKNLVLYSTLLFNSFQNKLNLASKDSLLAQIKELEAELKLAKDCLTDQQNVIADVINAKKEELKREKDKLAKTRAELEEYKKEKESEWQNEKKDLSARIAELKENFENLKVAASGESGELEKKNEETKQVVEELKVLKAEMAEEKTKLEEKATELTSIFETAREERQDMEDTVSKDQELVGSAIAKLSAQLNQHVENVNVLKVFLKQKTSYTSETVQALCRSEMEELNYEESMNAINKKLEEENALLKALFDEQVLILQETRKTSQFNRGSNKKRNIRAKSQKPKQTEKDPEAAKKKERKKTSEKSSRGEREKKEKRRRSRRKEEKKEENKS